jgi:CRP/FNR family transcriptional regulator
LIDDIERVGSIQDVSSGHMITDIGDPVQGLPLLISGFIKVLRVDSEDSELLVYFLERGDSSARTLSCFSGKIMKSSIRAIAEKDTVMINVPMKEVSSWMYKYPDWSTFVFQIA